MAESDDRAWTDKQGDVWRLGTDGLMHTPETVPFPREYVERKWGPLVERRPDDDPAPVAECNGRDCGGFRHG